MSTSGSVGLPATSGSEPGCVPVNVRVTVFTNTDEATAAPELARSGVLKYSYAGTVTCSMYEPSGLVSRSNTDIVASALRGSTSATPI